MTDEKMNIQLRMDKVVTEMEKIFDAYGLSDFYSRQTHGAAAANFTNRKGTWGQEKIMDNDDYERVKQLGEMYNYLIWINN